MVVLEVRVAPYDIGAVDDEIRDIGAELAAPAVQASAGGKLSKDGSDHGVDKERVRAALHTWGRAPQPGWT
jgi:hypothetical protein